MEITTRQAGDAYEVSVTGRLDAYWADHLGKALDEAIRDGADRIRLDLSRVSFISSVGIRVLLKFYKQLQRIKGSFVVSNPSEPVRSVLELAGLQALLGAADAAPAVAAVRAPSRSLERDGARFEVFELMPHASLRCRTVGRPELLDGCRFGSEHCRSLRSPAGTFAVGLGAFGNDFADCRARFGEFLTAAGAAAYLPTDGTDVPDYLVSAGALVPQLQVLYALVCEGSFAALARFESRRRDDRVGLGDVAEACLEVVGQDAAGVVMVVESAGLVGAALRRSPARAPSEAAPFAFPEVREWLSFTPERAFPRSLALVAGVVARTQRPELAAWLRPLRKEGGALGHFHAAAFSYRPLQKGAIDLVSTVTGLFEGESLQGVLHLLADDRELVGVGESELIRGACWIAPIGEIVAE
jgi:anti-anti-sigma factor